MAGSYQVVLRLDQEQRRFYARMLGLLRREWGVEEAEAVVLRALREAAARA